MQKEYVIQFYKTINKLLCNLSFAGQYIINFKLLHTLKGLTDQAKLFRGCIATFCEKQFILNDAFLIVEKTILFTPPPQKKKNIC